MPFPFDPQTALLVNSSTNATPIVVETQIAHGLANGDQVAIIDHLVNTNANGEWAVGVVDSTHLSLTNSVGNGVGAATGAVIPYTVGAIAFPSGGGAVSSAGIQASLAALADRIAFVRNLTVLSTREYTAGGTDVVPDGAILTLGIGWGAGGSGAGGAGGTTTSTIKGNSGGGGGGGARKVIQVGTFPPRSSQTVVIGASATGGVGGIHDANGANGNPGGDTTYGSTWTFPGGGPGSEGQGDVTLSAVYGLAFPGTPSKSVATGGLVDAGAYYIAFALSRQPGEGGYALVSSLPFAGAANGCDAEGFLGGIAGTDGTVSGGAHGGGGGGGGGAGPGGAGGTGGAGGNGGHAAIGGTANPGASGTSPAANSGAGSGGGGAGGSGDTGFGGSGANAADSGSGMLTIIHMGAPQ